MTTLPLLLGLIAAVGVVLVALGMRSSQATDAASLLRERLIRQELGLGQSAIALQLERPLLERLFEPLRKTIARQMNRLTPAAQAARFQRELDFIGNPFGLDPAGVQTLRIAAAAGFGAVGTALGILIGQPLALVVALAVGAILGFYLPMLWLRQLVSERRAQLEAVLPNALDVIAISMEAGLGLDRALEQLVRHQEGPLTLLVARALREIELGRPRADALNDMADATGVEDFTGLIRSILHAERTGVPIARTIAAHAAQMRVKRRLQIRADAARASLKILLPTVGCVFPTLWLILLGPALIVILSINNH
jgi:tight adherence protein C